MSISLHLVWGPTSTGKTAAAVTLAERTGAPVISLDRLQCCPDIPIGSGRPLPSELRGTQRIYLCSRRLIEGVIPASEANALLKLRVADCARRHGLIILEGGSVSLINTMIADPYWGRFLWRSDRFELGEPDLFLGRARARVREMFDRRESQPSLLDELASLWPDPQVRQALESIDGYRYAIRYARQRGLLAPQLRDLGVEVLRELVEGIAQEYLDHARWQTREFRNLPLSWKPCGDRVRDHEAVAV